MELSKNLLDTLRYKKTYLFLAVFHETCWKNSAHTLPSLEKKYFLVTVQRAWDLEKINQTQPSPSFFFFLLYYYGAWNLEKIESALDRR